MSAAAHEQRGSMDFPCFPAQKLLCKTKAGAHQLTYNNATYETCRHLR